MNLYRLDYVNADGSHETVRDSFLLRDQTAAPVLLRRLDRARESAIRRATGPTHLGGQRPVLVTKIHGAGILTPLIVASPDGKVSRV
jgi:hypothetical protein